LLYFFALFLLYLLYFHITYRFMAGFFIKYFRFMYRWILEFVIFPSRNSEFLQSPAVRVRDGLFEWIRFYLLHRSSLESFCRLVSSSDSWSSETRGKMMRVGERKEKLYKILSVSGWPGQAPGRPRDRVDFKADFATDEVVAFAEGEWALADRWSLVSHLI